MSEKQFTLDELYCYIIQDNKKRLTDKQVVDLLNEQQTTIEAKERRIMILENLLTQMGVQWVDDDG